MAAFTELHLPTTLQLSIFRRGGDEVVDDYGDEREGAEDVHKAHETGVEIGHGVAVYCVS
jgi:hypothetical protein